MHRAKLRITAPILTVLLVAAVSIPGCGHPDGADTKLNRSSQGSTVATGQGVQGTANRAGDGIADSLIGYITKASQLWGCVPDSYVITGTLRFSADGRASYSATPNDRMIVIGSDGSTTEFVLSDFTLNCDNHGHNVKFTYKTGSDADQQITDVRTGTTAAR